MKRLWLSVKVILEEQFNPYTLVFVQIKSMRHNVLIIEPLVSSG